MQGAPPLDLLATTGGSIGQGLPVGLGASIACPDRKVICLQADGAGMYTIQALWTMARENTDITVVLLNNKSYAILNLEFSRFSTNPPNRKAQDMLSLANPDISWVSLAQGMGVHASRVTTAVTRVNYAGGPTTIVSPVA